MSRLRISFLRLFWSFKREWRHHRGNFLLLLLLSIFFAFLFSRAVPSSKQAVGVVEDELKYRISLVTEENNMVLSLVKAELAQLPILDVVYQESAEVASKRLEEGETLLMIEFPDQFFYNFSSGIPTDTVLVHFQKRMPEEARRLAAMINNWLRALNRMRGDIYAWEALNDQYLGGDDQAFVRMTQYALEGSGYFTQRFTNVKLEESTPFMNFSYYLASLILLFSLLPSLLFFEERGREIASSRQMSMDRLEVNGYQFFVQVFLYFLLFLASTMPLILLSSKIIGRTDVLNLCFAPVIFFLTSILLMMALGTVSWGEGSRTAVAWLSLVYVMFFAGAIYPLELFPKSIQTWAQYSPMRPAFSFFLKQLAAKEQMIELKLTVLWPILPAFASAVFAEWRRRAR